MLIYSKLHLKSFDYLYKQDAAFICFDVVKLYPSISEALLNRALDFASQHVSISAIDRQIIINAKHSLLFSNFGSPHKLKHIQEISIQVKGTIINRTESFQYLGVTLHHSMSWADHIDSVVS